MTRTTLRQIQRMYMQGHTRHEVSEFTGIHIFTVRQYTRWLPCMPDGYGAIEQRNKRERSILAELAVARDRIRDLEKTGRETLAREWAAAKHPQMDGAQESQYIASVRMQDAYHEERDYKPFEEEETEVIWGDQA